MEIAQLAEEQNNRRKGMIISLVVHLMLLLFGIFYTFSYLDPPPEQPGIIVNIGFVDSGNMAEMPDQQNEKPQEKPAEATKEVIKEKPRTKPEIEPEAVKKAKPEPAKVESKTKVEEELIVAADKVTKKEKEDKIKEQKEAAAQIEANAKKQKEIEEAKAKKAAEDAKKKAAEDAKKKYGDLFGSGKGNNSTSGDQGDPNGKPNQDVLDGISKGSGKVGGGLGNRGILYEPVINDNSQKTGRVVIKVCVDSSGKVVSAQYTQKGSTTTDQDLIKIAETGAAKYKFSAQEIEKQCGTVTIDFKVK